MDNINNANLRRGALFYIWLRENFQVQQKRETNIQHNKSLQHYYLGTAKHTVDNIQLHPVYPNPVEFTPTKLDLSKLKTLRLYPLLHNALENPISLERASELLEINWARKVEGDGEVTCWGKILWEHLKDHGVLAHCFLTCCSYSFYFHFSISFNGTTKICIQKVHNQDIINNIQDMLIKMIPQLLKSLKQNDLWTNRQIICLTKTLTDTFVKAIWTWSNMLILKS